MSGTETKPLTQDERDNQFAAKLEKIEVTFDNKIEEINSEMEEVFNIDKDHLDSCYMLTVSKLHYWNSKLADETRFLQKISRTKSSCYSRLYQGYREGRIGHISMNNKNEIEAYIYKHSEYVYWENLYDEQKILVDYINNMCWALKNTQIQAIRGIQDFQKREGY
jgi:hypothetical protein